jgi:hypothetical protein
MNDSRQFAAMMPSAYALRNAEGGKKTPRKPSESPDFVML